MRPEYEKLARRLFEAKTEQRSYVEQCLASAAAGGANLVCDHCYSKIRRAR